MQALAGIIAEAKKPIEYEFQLRDIEKSCILYERKRRRCLEIYKRRGICRKLSQR